MLFTVNEEKLRLLHTDVDIDQIRRNLESFEMIARGDKNGGPIAQLEPAERFRWLTAMRSSVIQTSRPHPGLCNNMDNKVQNLFGELVL